MRKSKGKHREKAKKKPAGRKGVSMKLKITPTGVWVDDQKIEGVSQVDIKNISPIKSIEVLLHLRVDEVDVQYYSKELLRIKE